MVDRNKLIARLYRIEALVKGATTPGERVAATTARSKVVEKLLANPCPVQRDVLEDLAEAALDADPLSDEATDELMPDDPFVQLPTVAELRRVLQDWLDGERESDDVADWASDYVDKLVLPSYPSDDPRSIPIEVLMQLSCLPRQELMGEDIAELMAFLGGAEGDAGAAWERWFGHLEQVDWRSRRKVCR